MRPSRSDGLPAAVPAPAGAVAGALQRVLLTTDGNVGRILEAYSGEPIETLGIEQSIARSGGEPTALELAPGEQVLWRRAILRTSRSHHNLIYAESMIALDRLHPEVREGLLSTSEAIGRLLLTVRSETFREVLMSHTEPAGPLGAHFGIGEHDELFVRTYRIVTGGEPIIVITERFPTTWFAA